MTQFNSEAIAVTAKDIASGRFANGFVAVVWKQGRRIHAKLYDKSGNEIGSQCGDSKLTFWTTWTFYFDGAQFVFNVIGGDKRRGTSVLRKSKFDDRKQMERIHGANVVSQHLDHLAKRGT